MTTGPLTPTHVAIVLIIARLLFGPTRLPQTGRVLGRAMREFKQAIIGAEDTSPQAEIDAPPEAESSQARSEAEAAGHLTGGGR
jgi:sec-independent protein translocase protein TatA